MHALAPALTLLQVCSIERLSSQLDALSNGDPLQWVARLQRRRQRQTEVLPGVSPLRQLRLSNEDCLYVYTTLMLEQFRWDVPPLREQERPAFCRALRDLGQALNIHAIPCTIEGLECFRRQYEGQHCSYATCNERVSRAIGDGLMDPLPTCLRSLGYVGLSVLLEEHIRAAIGLSHLHPWIGSTVRRVITTYRHRVLQAERLRNLSGRQCDVVEDASRLVQQHRSDPVEFLVWTLCSARAAPPVVMNEPEVS